MFYTIYRIVHKENGKIYIGKHQTKNLDDGYMGSGKRLIYAQEKYGLETFEKEILYIFDNEEEMNAKEAELVTEEFCLREDTYNICPGGRGGWGYINSNDLSGLIEYNKSENHKKSSSLGGQNSKGGGGWGWDSTEKRRTGFKDKRHTQKWKENHSKIMKERASGKNNSQFGTMWITNGQESRKIKKDQDIPAGWKKGRII